MVKILILILTSMLSLTFCVKSVYAVSDPLSVPNNKFGVHILFVTELSEASNLVNSAGGDWGYITIPMQANDRDLEKWQKFMDDAGKLHLIPVIRIATENYYFDTSFWRKPLYEDVLDFANFLNSLEWPVKNRYVIIFNEVNRTDEWEGLANPYGYAGILSYAVKIFKSLSSDFFIISAGLDNGSANDQYSYMIRMNEAVPGIFSQIDGLGSHSYPNPAFSVPPWIATDKSISSFKFERNLAYELSGKNLPVFITETGWSREKVPENQIGQYFAYAFKNVWSDKNVIAVTPFILQAGAGPFSQFALLNENAQYNDVYAALKKIQKTKGKPIINIQPSFYFLESAADILFKTFPKTMQYEAFPAQRAKAITPFFKWLLKLSY